MNILICIDAIHTLDQETDSSLFFHDCLKQAYSTIKFFNPSTIEYDGSVRAECFELDASNNIINAISGYDLEQADLILLRQNPPVNMKYITDIQLLNTLSGPKLMNRPEKLLTYPEKTIPFDFKEYTPKTIISSNPDEIIAWVQRHKQAILKSVHGYGGKEVIFVDSDNTNKIMDFSKRFTHVIAQEFLPNIKYGDKRVLIIDGKIVGALRRTPKAGSILANMCQGGSANICDLTTNEQTISEKVAIWCKKHEVMFAGVDLIDERLIEVNITCPTGYKALHKLNHELKLPDLIIKAVRLWEADTITNK